MPIDFKKIEHLDQIALVRRSIVECKNGEGWRAIDLAMDAGFALRILPDRGMDLQNTWWRGVPLAWIGPAGEAAPRRDLNDHDWLDAFSGGLVTTCGLANVGEPSEGHGLHGRVNHCRAQDIKVDRWVADDEAHVSVSGVIVERTNDGGELRLSRRYTTSTGQSWLLIEDEVQNRGPAAAPAPFLYHVNFGWPIVDADLSVVVHGHADHRTVFGDLNDAPGGWRRPGAAMQTDMPVTLEHLFDAEGDLGTVSLRAPNRGVALELTWSRGTLPRLFQWINCLPGRSVVAIEPSNATTEGRAVDRALGRLAMLEPDARRKTWLRIQASTLT